MRRRGLRSLLISAALFLAPITVAGGLFRGASAGPAGAFPASAYIAPGVGLQDALRLLEQAGFSPTEAIAAATAVPGSLLDRSGRAKGLGRIAVDGPADLLVFRRDPTVMLKNLDSLETVIVAGRRYDTADLRRHLRSQLEASRRFPYSWAARLLGWLLSRFA